MFVDMGRHLCIGIQVRSIGCIMMVKDFYRLGKKHQHHQKNSDGLRAYFSSMSMLMVHATKII